MEHGDIVCWRPITDIYLVNHPDYVRPILMGDETSFSKKNIPNRIMAQVTRKGLPTSHGSHWARQRKLMQPFFATQSVQRFDGVINAVVSSRMDKWDRCVGGKVVWVDREMSALTFDIVGATVFGTDFAPYTDEFARIWEFLHLRAADPRYLMTLLPWVPTRHNRRWKGEMKRLDSIVYRILAARRDNPANGDDMLTRLGSARDEETGEGMSEEQMRDEVVSLMFAANEATAMALAWTLYLVATHPEIEARLREDLASELAGSPATGEDLKRLPYLKQVVQEAMRIYPPAWCIGRRAEREVELGEYLLPKGAHVWTVAYSLHRHPEFWPDPERFDPDRFSPDQSKDRHFFSYVPFSAGPRGCIAASLAMLEMQLVLAQVLQRFKIQIVPDYPIEPEGRVSLKPYRGIPVTLRLH